jgi:hypothetical protein
MRRQKPNFKEGDIVKNSRNNFRRLIHSVGYEERTGIMKVMYHYFDEELDTLSMPTGNFNQSHFGYCSQDQLMNWRRGR